MEKIGIFQIQFSHKVTNRGLVALGQIIEGRVKIGSYVTLNVNEEILTLKIASIEMADNISTRESWVTTRHRKMLSRTIPVGWTMILRQVPSHG